MIGRLHIVAGLVVSAAVAALWGLLDTRTEPGAVVETPHAGGPPRAAVSVARPLGTRADAPASDPRATFERWISVGSSLRGAELDGDWGLLDPQGRLVPSRAVRQRFDQLLTLQGETSLDQLLVFVEHSAQQALGAAGAAQLIDLWHRYLGLLGRRYSTRVDPSDPSTWPLALAEHRAARRAVLGPEWGLAFYAQEESELEALIQGAADPPAGTTPVPLDVSDALSPAAQQRLAAERQAWADWEARVAQVRLEWARLQRQENLSDAMRLAEIEAWIGQRFDTAEQRRVRALLRVPQKPS